jgi:hypothetical protein
MAKNLFFFFFSTLVKNFIFFKTEKPFFLAVNLKTVRATISSVRKLTTVGK